MGACDVTAMQQIARVLRRLKIPTVARAIREAHKNPRDIIFCTNCKLFFALDSLLILDTLTLTQAR
jgi:hypothetical protein